MTLMAAVVFTTSYTLCHTHSNYFIFLSYSSVSSELQSCLLWLSSNVKNIALSNSASKSALVKISQNIQPVIWSVNFISLGRLSFSLLACFQLAGVLFRYSFSQGSFVTLALVTSFGFLMFRTPTLSPFFGLCSVWVEHIFCFTIVSALRGEYLRCSMSKFFALFLLCCGFNGK